MELLNKIKKSDKQSFNTLLEPYHHILYKTARVYLKSDKEVNNVIKNTLTKSFRDIINVKEESDFLIWVLQNLIDESQKVALANKNDVDKRISNSEISLNIGDKFTYVSSDADNPEYQAYRHESIVEEYITSIPENLRIIALLYYYADLSCKDISRILRVPEFTISSKIKKIRIQLYEIIKTKEADL